MLPVGTNVSVGRRDGVIERVVGEDGYIVRFLGGGSQFIQRKLVQRNNIARGAFMVPQESNALRRAFC